MEKLTNELDYIRRSLKALDKEFPSEGIAEKMIVLIDEYKQLIKLQTNIKLFVNEDRTIRIDEFLKMVDIMFDIDVRVGIILYQRIEEKLREYVIVPSKRRNKGNNNLADIRRENGDELNVSDKLTLKYIRERVEINKETTINEIQ